LENTENNEFQHNVNEEAKKSNTSGLNFILKFLALIVIGILGYLITTTTLRDYGKNEVVYPDGQKVEDEFEGSVMINAEKNDTVVVFDPPYSPSDENNTSSTSQITDTQQQSKVIVQPQSGKATPTDNTASTEKNVVTTKPKELKEQAVSTAPVKSEISKSSSTNNNILVIAGNYIQESNAKELEKKLKKAGIQNTEIIVFDFSEFHTVIVGRYNDINSAKKMVSTLKAKGFDAYTHQKRSKNN
jgi:septal ring-binding cell division protein DamX